MRKKLLLADDSITIQKVVELTFPSDEFEVVTAANGKIAVDKAMTFLPDIVLCDVIMPQMDGYQVCAALRASAQLKAVPILLLNGAFEPYDAEKAKSVGALGNVSKPFDPPALVARVKEILAERNTAAIDRAAYDAAVQAAAPAAEEAAAEPQVVEYDDSETVPASTVEVPMDVREMAARSLSLDAPVFAAEEPEVLTTEAEPSDFSETLHGPLDEGAPAAQELPAAAAESMEAVEEIEAIEEMEPVAPTGEFETPKGLSAPAPASSESALPGTLPPRAAPPAPAAEEFGGEHEFSADELDAAAGVKSEDIPEELPSAVEPLEAKTEPLPPEPEPEPMELQAMAEPEPMAIPEVEAPAPQAAIGLPAPPPRTEPARPAVVAPAAPAAELPSAEVAVPMDMVQQIAQRVISQVSERVIREIAWDVIPGLAEKLVKAEIERIKARAESERD